jgi:hypothetical protein
MLIEESLLNKELIEAVLNSFQVFIILVSTYYLVKGGNSLTKYELLRKRVFRDQDRLSEKIDELEFHENFLKDKLDKNKSFERIKSILVGSTSKIQVNYRIKPNLEEDIKRGVLKKPSFLKKVKGEYKIIQTKFNFAKHFKEEGIEYIEEIEGDTPIWPKKKEGRSILNVLRKGFYLKALEENKEKLKEEFLFVEILKEEELIKFPEPVGGILMEILKESKGTPEQRYLEGVFESKYKLNKKRFVFFNMLGEMEGNLDLRVELTRELVKIWQEVRCTKNPEKIKLNAKKTDFETIFKKGNKLSEDSLIRNNRLDFYDLTINNKKKGES